MIRRTDTWETLAKGLKFDTLHVRPFLKGKYYVMGWHLGRVKVWRFMTPVQLIPGRGFEGVPMPVEVDHCAAITYERQNLCDW